TFDEPAHLAAGMQRLATGRYDDDAQRPPLGRIAAAVGPYLHGDRSVGASSAYDEGARLLGRGAHYRTTLALARLGELPFFLLLCGVLWTWGRQLTDDRGGAIAVSLAASNPNLLAHAGLATTDIALAATITASLFAFVLWLDAPRWTHSLALGIALGLSATTDYASLAMLALAFPAVYLTRRRATGRAPIWPDNAGRRGSPRPLPRRRQFSSPPHSRATTPAFGSSYRSTRSLRSLAPPPSSSCGTIARRASLPVAWCVPSSPPRSSPSRLYRCGRILTI